MRVWHLDVCVDYGRSRGGLDPNYDPISSIMVLGLFENSVTKKYYFFLFEDAQFYI